MCVCVCVCQVVRLFLLSYIVEDRIEGDFTCVLDRDKNNLEKNNCGDGNNKERKKRCR